MATWNYSEKNTAPGRTDFLIEGHIKAADLTDADTSQDIAVVGWPANSYKLHAVAVVGEAFEDTGTSALTNMAVTIGDTADADGMLTTQAVALDETPTVGALLRGDGAESNDGALEAAYSPFVRFTSTAANLDTVITGKLSVYLSGYYFDPK